MLGYILVGVLSGIISGMGIGGGTVLIPALTMIWGIEQKLAQSINLIYFIPTAIIALFSHAKQGNIDKKILPLIIAGGFVGAAAGSFFALSLNSEMLRKFFGGFLCIMGILEIFKKK